ncbi:MAG: putative capsid protein [Cressdnaviricota sp.]|nr:MAG: putative capsid protein [Cressdnaviricota sp.]
MVKRKRRTFKTRRRRKKRRRKGSAVLRAVTSGNKPIADSLVVKLRFSDFVTIDPTAATASTVVYRANSIFDPRYATGGNQPLGMDQWSAFYDHYVVLGSKITVKFIPSTFTPVLGSAIVGISLQDDATTTAGVGLQMIERAGSKWGIMTGSDSTGYKSLTKSFSTKKFFGIKDVADNIAKLGATTGANPSEAAYFHVSAGPVDNSSNASPLTAIIQIDYIIKFVERKALTGS